MSESLESEECQPQPKIEALLDYLEGLEEKYIIHGHGTTSRKSAQDILEHGLFTGWSNLHSISHPLQEARERRARQLEAWEYEARRYVVLIAAPRNDEYSATGSTDDERGAWENEKRSNAYAEKYVFEKVDAPTKSMAARHLRSDKRVPPSKIVGYWDDEQGQFVGNPYFETE